VKPELSFEYLQSIENDPLPRAVEISEAGWVEEWKRQVAAAIEIPAPENYEAFPTSWTIPKEAWEPKLRASWARLAEYDRLTAERKAS